VSAAVIRNLTAINESGSILSPSDISFDKTEEDLDDDVRVIRGAKRPSASAVVANDDDDTVDDVVPPGKRSRRRVVGVCMECFL